MFDVEKGDDIMTGKEIYETLHDYLVQQSVLGWAQKEFDESVKMGITDGQNPMRLIPRYQAAIMAKRAVEK